MCGIGRGKRKARDVEAVIVTAGGGIGQRVLIEGGDRSGVGAVAQRAGSQSRAVGVHLFNLSGGERLNTAGCGRVGDAAVAQGETGHVAADFYIFRLALAFIGAEEEQAVFQNGAPERAAKRIANDFLWDVGLAVQQLGVLVEPAVGRGDRRAILFVERAMKGVGAALGDQRDLTSGGAALIGIVACCGDTKLFDGIERGANGAFEGGAANLVVVVDTVENNVGLVAAAAIESAVACVNVVVDVVADERDARLQAEDSGGIAAFEGKRQDLVRVEGIAKGCVSRVHRSCATFYNCHGIGHRAELHFDF